MTIRWLAFLGCALISLPFTPAATAQTQLALNSEVPSSSATTLSASASGSSTFLLGAPGLWVAQDAIPLANIGKIDTESETPTAAPDMSNCRWTLEPANAWSCKIKPLSRYDFPIRKVGHYLWPLHRANSQ